MAKDDARWKALQGVEIMDPFPTDTWRCESCGRQFRKIFFGEDNCPICDESSDESTSNEVR